MTAKELREAAAEISEITGAHGMNKAELVQAIKKARGIVDETAAPKGGSARDIKKKIKALKGMREEALGAKDKKMSTIYRRRISRLKKRARHAA